MPATSVNEVIAAHLTRLLNSWGYYVLTEYANDIPVSICFPRDAVRYRIHIVTHRGRNNILTEITNRRFHIHFTEHLEHPDSLERFEAKLRERFQYP